MIKILHFNDGKEKWQSHEVSIRDDFVPTNESKELDVWDLDIFNTYGYGESYDEALNNFVKKFDYEIEQLIAFQKILHEVNAGSLDIGVVEIDCLGKEINPMNR